MPGKSTGSVRGVLGFFKDLRICQKLGLISWRTPPPFKSSQHNQWSNQQDDPSWLDFSQDIPFDYSQIH